MNTKSKESKNDKNNSKPLKYRVSNATLGETVEITVNSIEELEEVRKEVLRVIYQSWPESLS